MREYRRHRRREAEDLRSEDAGLAVLLAPRQAQEELAAARRRLESRLSRCRRMTAAYGGAGSRGGGYSGQEEWAETADLVEEVRQRQREVQAARKRAVELLAELAAQGEKQRRSAVLLHQRYVLGRSWPQVRKALERQGFSAGAERTVYNWHRAAVEMLE